MSEDSSNPPAYLIVRVNILDPVAYGEYMKHTPRAIKQYGGRFIARGAEPTTLEGEKETRRVVIVEFESEEKAKAFYHSPEYQETMKLREGKADAQLIVIGGFPIEAWNKVVESSERLASSGASD